VPNGQFLASIFSTNPNKITQPGGDDRGIAEKMVENASEHVFSIVDDFFDVFKGHTGKSHYEISRF